MMRIFIFTLLFGLLFSGLLLADENMVVPYMLKAPEPITVDGFLDEWAFAFPLDHSVYTIPDSGRFKAEAPQWVPDPEDCSGTIYLMYDEEHIYFAAHVRDDEPGHFSESEWATDGIEIYMCNWDIGDKLVIETPEVRNNPDNGDYDLQVTIGLDESLDSTYVWVWGEFNKIIQTEGTFADFTIWDDGTGYDLEGQIYLPDLTSPSTGNTMHFTPGTRVAMTWSLYDMDETENSADFQGMAYTPKGYAGWMGPGPGYQCIDVLETPRGDAWNNGADFDFASPYMKRAPEMSIDGNLDEWGFCFPLDHWCSSIPEHGRFNEENPAWFPFYDENLKGRIMVMYDDDHLYMAAHVMDDEPGHFSESEWAADAIEIYMANWDIGDSLHTLGRANGNNQETGDYWIQLTMAYDESLDSAYVQVWGEFSQKISNEETFAVGKVWDDGMGYDIEVSVYLPDLDSPSTKNYFNFAELVGCRLSQTWSLYDIDETENSADFQGLAYTPVGYAGWMGPGLGFQYSDVKDISTIEAIDKWFEDGAYPPIDPTSVNDFANKGASLPVDYNLANYPNPFNPSTNIQFSLKKAGEVNLNIYNLNGQLVRTIVNNKKHAAGTHTLKVDMSNMPSGVYFTVLEHAGNRVTNKMLLVK